MTTQSLIMPVFNGARLIREALDSALPQLTPDDEVIVVENGSTDNTRAIVEQYPDRRIRLLTLPVPSLTAARNHGIRHARGEFISFLDYDDLWPAGRQHGLISAFNAEPGSEAAMGRMRVRYDPGSEGDEARYGGMDGQHVRGAMVSVFMFHRSLLERVGPFDETLQHAEDLDYMSRAWQAGMRCAVYDGDSLIYRRHDANMTRDREATSAGVLAMMRRNIARRRTNKDGDA